MWQKKRPMVSLSRQIVSNLAELTKGNKDKEDSARLKRTRVVLKPGNTTIRRSSDIRKEFNKYFQGLIVRNCRVTAGGAITLEFIDDATAERVDTEWSENYFGGNRGLKRPGESNTFGIIKYVYDDVSEDEIIDDIVKQFPGVECDFFKRKSDNKFSGMINVDFKSHTLLQQVITDEIKILSQRYIVEEFVRKSRVIKCNNCQSWDHVHRYCVKAAKCAKCGENHETRTCTVNKGFVCCHCKGAHRAGSVNCKVYKRSGSIPRKGVMIKPSGNSLNGNSAVAHLCSINICGLSQRSHMLLDKYKYDKDIMLLAVQETGDLSNSRYKYLNNMNTFEDTNQQRNNGKEKHYVHTN